MGAPKIKEDEYKTIKLLSKQTKMTQEQIAEVVGRCVSATARVLQTETYEEYTQKCNENSRKYNAKRSAKGTLTQEQETPHIPAAQVVEHRQTVTIQATHYMMTEMQKTNELLAAISRKLAFIVDELCGTAGKKEG